MSIHVICNITYICYVAVNTGKWGGREEEVERGKEGGKERRKRTG